jgi:hypothetical protein
MRVVCYCNVPLKKMINNKCASDVIGDEKALFSQDLTNEWLLKVCEIYFHKNNRLIDEMYRS